MGDTSITEKEEKEKKVPCTDCDKSFPANSIKKHMAKHKREKKVHNEESKDSNDLDRSGHEDFADERIPCTQCGKMLPKNAMKRHLMKHETISHESDTEKISTEKSEDDISQDTGEDEKQKVSRKKVTCVECGLQCASNVIKRHLEKHAKIKALDKSVTPNEIYAPIEITPTKEYWEYEKEKNGPKSTDGNENNEDKETGQNTQNSTNPSEYRERGDLQQRKSKDEKRERSRSRKGSVDKDPVHKAVKELKESEKAKNSEEESESENPLETAVRKVVSYRMTPKQALSIYNLTPKVLFDNLLGETDNDRMSILKKVNLSLSGEKKVINYCKQNEAQLSYKAVINCVRDLKVKDGNQDFSLTRLEAYRWWYAFRKILISKSQRKRNKTTEFDMKCLSQSFTA